MDFCSKCGSRLIPRKVKSANQRLVILSCSKCGNKEKEKNNNQMQLNSKTIPHNPKQLVAVIDKEKQLSTMPTIHFTCLRCGNQNAYAWQVQTRGSDESSTQFLRCTSCGYTFRENT
jgi:DNA-directed RNA polymerase subunit M